MKMHFLIYLFLVLVVTININFVYADDTTIDEMLQIANEKIDLKKLDEALIFIDKVLEIDPENVEALNKKGGLLANLGKLDEALIFIDKVLEMDPENVRALSNKGGVLGKLGQYDDALIFIDKVLEMDPENVGALNNKGGVLTKLKKYDEALTYLEKGLEIDPKHLDSLKSLFRIYQGGKLVDADGFVQSILRNSEGELIGYFETDRMYKIDSKLFDEMLYNTEGIFRIRDVSLDGQDFKLIQFKSVWQIQNVGMVGRLGIENNHPIYDILTFEILHARHHAFSVEEGDTITSYWQLVLPPL